MLEKLVCFINVEEAVELFKVEELEESVPSQEMIRGPN